MDLRGGFLPRPPRDRGGLMRPAFPFRPPRGVMLMDRPRLGPPRPPLMRGVPPFVGRGLLPPARHRGLGPVMLPRPLPPPGALGPHLGPRALMPRPMLPPPRPLHSDLIELPESTNGITRDEEEDENVSTEISSGLNANQTGSGHLNQSNKNNRTEKVNQNAGQQPNSNRKNRKDTKNRKGPPVQQSQQTPASHHVQVASHSPVQPTHPSPLKQNAHPSHQLQQPPPQQNVVCMNQAPVQKHVPSMQTPMNTNIQSQSPQLPMPQSVRGGRNGSNYRNRGNAHVGGRANIPNTPPSVGMNQGHVMNLGGPNVPVRGGMTHAPPRPNVMMNVPPPQYSNAPPPSNYAAPPPVMTQQMPIKRGAPPVGPPVMQPKRIRYEPPPPSNGYMQYQQQPPPQPQPQPLPPPQQPVYQSYEVPPPTDMYGNMPPVNVNIVPQQQPQQQQYAPPVPDYNNYQAVAPQQPTSYCPTVNQQYSTSYANQGTYSTYAPTTGYDQSVDYSAVPQQQSNVDPYGYAKPVDSYGYTNTSYGAPQQTGYEDYSSGYVDQSGYASTVQDPSYGQSVGTYPAYSY